MTNNVCHISIINNCLIIWQALFAIYFLISLYGFQRPMWTSSTGPGGGIARDYE